MATKAMNIRTTQTKRNLIQAFTQLVSKKDFEKITIADITKAAQVNRATFYAHFKDKYELLDFMMGDSAAAIIKGTKGEGKFDQDTVIQLVIALCGFYEQPEFECRTSYISLVVPQLREKTIKALSIFLSGSLRCSYSEEEMKIYVPLYAQMIHEAAVQWATGDIRMNKADYAARVASLIIGGFESSKFTS